MAGIRIQGNRRRVGGLTSTSITSRIIPASSKPVYVVRLGIILYCSLPPPSFPPQIVPLFQCLLPNGLSVMINLCYNTSHKRSNQLTFTSTLNGCCFIYQQILTSELCINTCAMSIFQYVNYESDVIIIIILLFNNALFSKVVCTE